MRDRHAAHAPGHLRDYERDPFMTLVAVEDSVYLRLLGAEVRYYQGPKFRSRVLEAGNGEPLILLHGIGGHAETYVRNIVPLGRNFRAMAMDFLWHGYSQKPPF